MTWLDRLIGRLLDLPRIEREVAEWWKEIGDA